LINAILPHPILIRVSFYKTMGLRF